jgi:hypothetical protein
MKAKDLKDTPPNICIVGTAGCGKTALVSQAGNDCYMLSFDPNGMRTARNLQDDFSKFRQAIEFDDFVDADPFKPDGFMRAKRKINELVDKPPRAVVVDSLTGLCSTIMRFVMKTNKQNAFATPEIQHWGFMINELEQVLAVLRSIPCMSLMTAHDSFATGKDNSLVHTIMSITQNHGRNKISWMFDEVLYMRTRPAGSGRYKYTVSTQGDGLPVRTRSGLFTDVDVTTIGLQGLLERVGYDYEPKA